MRQAALTQDPLLRPMTGPSLIERLRRRPLVRDVATVAGGTAAAQLVTLAAAPLLTRLYGPEVYGLQGVFASLVGVLAVAAALGFPLAIVLPARDAEARALARLSLSLAVVATGLFALLLALAGAPLLSLLGAGALLPLAGLLPLGVLATVATAVFTQWLARRGAWRFSARWTLGSALLVNGGKVGLGLVQPCALSLIGAQVGGQLLALAAAAALWWRREPRPDAPALSMREAASRHRDFARYRTPQNLINALSQSLPLLLLSAGAGPAAAGQYAVAMAVLAVPVALIAGAMQQVFYPRVAEAVRRGEDVRALLWRTTRALALASALPFLLLVLAAPGLFAVVFGADWREGGEYARWLAAWMWLQCVNVPAVAAVPSLGLQRGLLVYEVMSTAAKAVALWVGLSVLGDDVAAVALFAGAGVLAYLGLIGWVLWCAGRAGRST